jgi:hypothetical protein
MNVERFVASLLSGAGPRIDAGRGDDALTEQDVNDRIVAVGLAQHPRREHLRALALLWHDHLDASHRISQGLSDPEGAYLHAMMHRREGDHENAHYWFDRIDGLDRRLGLDAGAFLAACRDPAPTRDAELRAVQAREFRLLAAHLYGVGQRTANT